MLKVSFWYSIGLSCLNMTERKADGKFWEHTGDLSEFHFRVMVSHLSKESLKSVFIVIFHWIQQILHVKNCEESKIILYISLKILLHHFSCFWAERNILWAETLKTFCLQTIFLRIRVQWTALEVKTVSLSRTYSIFIYFPV